MSEKYVKATFFDPIDWSCRCAECMAWYAAQGARPSQAEVVEPEHAPPPLACETRNCIRPRKDGERRCVFCIREDQGLPRYQECR